MRRTPGSQLFAWFLPHWAQSRHPDPNHSHRRRFTAAYRRKREIVKSLWIASGLVMLAFPLLPLIVGLSLFTTFMAFVVLDETA